VRFPARTRRALHTIETALEASDPRLTAMFAMFARLTRGEETVSSEHLSRRIRWRHSSYFYMLFPVLASIALAVSLVVGLATSGSPPCGRVPAVAGTAASCAALPTRPAGH
jgi:Protein of unknown function (DUF3040)